MVYYKMAEYKLKGFEKSKRKRKMYNALLLNKETKTIIKVPFGDNQMQNFTDKTGLNSYPNLIHGDDKRRKAFRARHKGYLRKGFYSPSYFSYHYLW
jgi:hypothetical protein